VGLPGTSGFVGEFLALVGTFQARPIMAIIAGSGVIFAVYYMLPMVQKVFFNALEKKENMEMPDLSSRELVILTPMLALMIWIGVQPTPFLERMEPSVQAVLERVSEGQLEAQAGLEAEAPVTFSSTSPLEETGETDELPLTTSGDED
jgi:NADH-quinone oxidoreductase subunit M